MVKAKLLELLRTYFDDSELRDICFSLNVDYESLPGESKADKSRELIASLERRDRIADLVAVCRQLRPNIPWQEAKVGTDEARQQSVRSIRGRVLALCPLFGASKTYYSELLDAILERADRYNYQLTIQPVDLNNKRHLHEYHSLNEFNGVIAITCQVEDTTWIEECKAAQMPMVLIHDNIPETKLKGATIASSIRPGLNALEQLVHHFIKDHHCRNICIVMVKENGHAIRQQKLDIVRNAIKKNNLRFDERTQLFYVPEYSYAEGQRIANDILQINPLVDAVISLADVTAISIMHEFKSKGQPQIRVAGFDNIEIAQLFDLTSVDQYLKTIGQQAMQDLDDALENGKTDFEQLTYIPTDLKLRASCCSPDTNNPK